ncbi:MAG: phage major capsid protein [Candidatus Peribacteraceae bacterium]|nr:phage major capsid protein [Candidatus Peribacteraceae bacterium]
MSTADLTKATRELFDRTLVNQVMYRTPIIERLQRQNQITFNGGLDIRKLVDTDTIEDTVQEYTVNEALTDQKKTTLEKPVFKWKYAQMPLRYDADELTENILTSDSEIQLLDLAAHLVKSGQRDARRYLETVIFNKASTTPQTDAGKPMQSLVSALNHDTQYAGITRTLSTSTADWWQGAISTDLTINTTTSGQDTATNLTIANTRKWVAETDVAHYMETPQEIMYAMCPTLFNKLRAETESKLIYNAPSADMVTQGFNKMQLDGHEVVSVPYLQRSSTTKTWFFVLNMNFFELRMHTARNFVMKDFVWQGTQSNGFDFFLARILLKGNFVCWKPNSSLWLSAVS